jgi:hypothetical protein
MRWGAAAAFAVAAAPTGVAHTPTLCVCARLVHTPYCLCSSSFLLVCAHLVVCLFLLVPATWSHSSGLCLCAFVLVLACSGLFGLVPANCNAVIHSSLQHYIRIRPPASLLGNRSFNCTYTQFV